METMTVRVPASADQERRSHWAVWLIAAAAYAVELAVSGRYGYDCDELYFLVAGQHLAAGYVDQPALTPLLARLFSLATGDTLVGLRALTALGLPLMVLLTASMARMLGASRAGQVIAALATACCAEYLGAFHLLTTTPVDFVGWTVLLWLVVRLLTSGDVRWWLPAGLVAGVALSAKWNIGFLIAGLAIGLLVTLRASRALGSSRALLPLPFHLACLRRTPRPSGPSPARPIARSYARWRSLRLAAPIIAVTAAVVLASPDVAWQETHGWANLGVFASLQQAAWHNRAVYWPSQALYTSVALVPLWIRGLLRLLREPRLRAVGVAAAFVIAAQFVLGGKPYYPGGVYPVLFAAGAIGVERIAARAAAYCSAGAASILIALPVLPATTLAHVPLQDINNDLGEQIAWPREVALVARVYAALPPSGRSVTAVLAGNYAEAGAVDQYGPSLGLPSAYSGHNAFWWWGPPPARDTAVVAIGVDPSILRAQFTSVRLVATYDNGLGISAPEQGVQVYIATGRRTSWAAAWPAFRHYG
ncbi:MAG TPA: glycosyltransferase family 39 protein [Trebonia sp.]